MKHTPVRATLVAQPVARLFDEATAAAYLGISKTNFRERCEASELPAPILIGQRRLWDRVLLDRYVDQLSGLGASSNPWDES